MALVALAFVGLPGIWASYLLLTEVRTDREGLVVRGWFPKKKLLWSEIAGFGVLPDDAVRAARVSASPYMDTL